MSLKMKKTKTKDNSQGKIFINVVNTLKRYCVGLSSKRITASSEKLKSMGISWQCDLQDDVQITQSKNKK